MGSEGARFGETQQSWAQDLAAGHKKSEGWTKPGLLPSRMAPTNQTEPFPGSGIPVVQQAGKG